MNTSRRDFIKKSALAFAGTSILSHSLFAIKSKEELLGLQLYCVREEMELDPLGTLKQLAEIGYKNVEHANYVDRKFYGYSAKEFKKILKDLGMKMPSGHTVLRKSFSSDGLMTNFCPIVAASSTVYFHISVKSFPDQFSGWSIVRPFGRIHGTTKFLEETR